MNVPDLENHDILSNFQIRLFTEGYENAVEWAIFEGKLPPKFEPLRGSRPKTHRTLGIYPENVTAKFGDSPFPRFYVGVATDVLRHTTKTR